jgi:hypothetical protein
MIGVKAPIAVSAERTQSAVGATEVTVLESDVVMPITPKSCRFCRSIVGMDTFVVVALAREVTIAAGAKMGIRGRARMTTTRNGTSTKRRSRGWETIEDNDGRVGPQKLHQRSVFLRPKISYTYWTVSRSVTPAKM